MARSDVRNLRAEATQAVVEGKHRRALACYLELEQHEPGDPNWPKRAAEVYRRMGKTRDAVAAYDRAVERYAQRGFLVQAIAVCKIILQLDPGHEGTRTRLAGITAQQQSAGTRVDALVDRHRADRDLKTRGDAADQPIAAPSRASVDTGQAEPVTAAPPAAPAPPPAATPAPSPREAVTPIAPRAAPAAPPPPPAAPPPPSAEPPAADDASRARRASSDPIALDPGAPLDSVVLAGAVPGAQPEMRDDGSASGIIVIPIDDPIDGDELTGEVPVVEIRVSDVEEQDTGPQVRYEFDDDPIEELSVEDLEDVPSLDAISPYSAAARRALAATPLFAGLSAAALEDLIERLDLLDLPPGHVLFRQGQPGSTLYVVVEGEVSVTSEGPPAVEMTRLGASAFFGEVALVTEQPRTATITTTEPTQLLAIDRDVIRALVGEHPDVLVVILRFLRDRLVDRLVQTHPLFAPHADAERRYLASCFRFVEIDPGTVIIEQGERPAGLYVLLAGRAEVRRDATPVATLEPGDVFGETALLTAQPCAVSITTAPRCLALCMPAAAFREVIMTHPLVLSYIGELVEQRRRTLDEVLDATHVDLV